MDLHRLPAGLGTPRGDGGCGFCGGSIDDPEATELLVSGDGWP